MKPSRFLLFVAIGVGVVARVFLVALRPLWADEIFTLTLARHPVAEILASLRIDSGPPLHYLLAHALLAPFGPAPGGQDVLVRLVSLAASLLHFPLFRAVARRLGRPDLGLQAAAAFALFPLAVEYASEGRAYALASLLVLAALERALALREAPSLARGATLALLCSAAVLTHYLALFPIAGLALLAFRTDRRGRLALAASGAAAALLVLPWARVALAQPQASMAWASAEPWAGARSFATNLVLGLQPPPPWEALTLAVALACVAALAWTTWRSAVHEVWAMILIGVLLLFAVRPLRPAVLLRERSALPFLPLSALVVGAAPAAAAAPVLGVAAAGLAWRVPYLSAPSAGELFAELLLPRARAGRRVCAVGFWGPELDYRLARGGEPGMVVAFPSSVRAHPGWYDDREMDGPALAAEANALVGSGSRPSLYVLPRGSLASAALAARLAPLKPVRVLSSPLIDIVEVGARSGGRSDAPAQPSTSR